jgi:hypothetical protein
MAKVRLAKISHVHYRYRHLEKAHAFLLDFGFLEVERRNNRIFYGGYGVEPFILCAEKANEDEFGGASFAVDSLDDLKLAASLPGATAILDLDAPGGGKCVTLTDPVNNFPLHLVHGQSHVMYEAGKEHHGTGPFNYVRLSLRCVSATRRAADKQHTACGQKSHCWPVPKV